MRASIASLSCGLLAFSAIVIQGQEPPPAVTGYITRAASASDFDANGIRILCGTETLTLTAIKPNVEDTANGCPKTPPYVGEAVTIWGSIKKKDHAVEATRIEFSLPASARVAGSAIIEELKPSGSPGPQQAAVLVRADGYWIRIDAKNEVKLTPSLGSLAHVKPGDWIDYKGTLGADGIVMASLIEIGPSVITPGEQKLRAKYEFDPSATPPSDTKKSAVEHAVIGGFDRAEFPPYNDPAMQARVNAVGEKLIPAFERNLPDADPAKIHFRFQLVDSARVRDALTLPNGIILIPHQVVERLQNDAQLAAVLADNIACALERQQYRTQTKARLGAAESWGGLAYVAASSSVLIPVAGDFVALEGMEARSETVTYGLQQSGRVSLELLHDAGYDIDEAPMAWWLVAAKNPKPVPEVELPPRAAYLYHVLGETWHNPAANISQAN